MKKAVILLSGGLDSATCLAIAKRDGFACYTMSFDYGQRNRAELNASRRLSEAAGAVRHIEFPLDLRMWGASALTDDAIAVPEECAHPGEVPVTYVPARNLVFLSLAAAFGEAMDCRDLFIGVNDVDFSNYPDCRAAFIDAFARAATLGTKAALNGETWTIHTPLQNLSKKEIIELGVSLGVDYSRTVSCYNADADGRACGVCASCRLRKEGFAAAAIPDPTRYR
ncbi:MAG: 7-cyano-7-deazaguanine synthase QueC [Victivallaceae bacterium]|nr:7-cyano-7-deazaguanine synthase QueC [Victivallaceae bacterium]